MSFIPKVVRVASNDKGRDFFVGDIHGCLSLLNEELERVAFDRSRDRLFSVGDLIDRGPDSLGVLRLLREPWFFAVRGNHEDMFLCALGLKPDPLTTYHDFLNNGGNWALYVNKKELMELAEIVKNLPHILTTLVGGQRINVVHAGIASVSNGELVFFSDEDIDAWEQELPGTKTINETDLIWERILFPSRKKYGRTKDLSTTFCGHTIGNDVRKNASHINIDTGGFKKMQGREVRLTLMTVSG